MDNHLIIGIGGTGGKIIANFRKHIAEKFGDVNDTRTQNIRYLWVDSSKSELEKTGGMWSTKGKDISLGNQDKLHIQGTGLHNAVQPPIDSNLKNWIGTKTDWGHLVSDSNETIAAGGQIRRLGRFNFAQHISTFNNKVGQSINSVLKDNDKGEIVIHLMAGLAGGTGSGAIIDAANQILKNYASNTNFRLLIYAVTPVLRPDISHMGKYGDISFYHANGYAALKELNGLMTNNFAPYDISDFSGSITSEKVSQKPNNFFLFTEQNQEGQEYSSEVLHKKIANVLYLNTVAFAVKDKSKLKSNSESAEESLERIITGENYVLPSDSNWGMSGKNTGISVQSLYIPKKEIEEYLALEMMINAIDSTLANTFRDKEGYLHYEAAEEFLNEAQQALNAEIRNSVCCRVKSITVPVILREWYLTTDFAILDTFPNSKLIREYPSFKSEIDEELNKVTSELLDNKGNLNGAQYKELNYLDAIERYMKGYMFDQFREIGLDSYFKKMKSRENIRDIVKVIIENLDRNIFALNNGSKVEEFCSFYNYKALLGVIVDEYLVDLKKFHNDLIRDFEREYNVAYDAKENSKKEYIATFGIIPKKRKREIAKANFLENSLTIHTKDCEIEGLKYSIDLISHLQTAIKSEVKEPLENIINSLAEIRQDLQGSYVKLKDKVLSSSNNQNGAEGFACSNDEGFNEFIRNWKNDQPAFDDIIRKYKEELFDVIPTYLRKTNDVSSALEVLSNKSVQLAGEALALLQEDDNVTDNFYNVPIIDILIEKYNGNVNHPEFQNLLDSLTSASAPLFQYNAQGMDNPEPIKTVILPKVEGEQGGKDDRTRFLQNLKNELNKRGVSFENGEFEDELMFVQFRSNISLDRITRINDLKKEYDTILSSRESGTANFLVHLQNSGHLDELERPSLTSIITAKFPNLLVIQCNDGFEKSETGELRIVFRDEQGIINTGDQLNLGVTDVFELIDNQHEETWAKICDKSNFALINKCFNKVKSEDAIAKAHELITLRLKNMEQQGALGSPIYVTTRKIYTKLKSMISYVAVH